MAPEQIARHLRRANAVARRAAAMGRHPFGALLVAPDDETDMETAEDTPARPKKSAKKKADAPTEAAEAKPAAKKAPAKKAEAAAEEKPAAKKAPAKKAAAKK